MDLMTFGVLKKSALSEEIVAKLLRLIQEKKLRPGDKLPPERDLAAQMQVSRPSLREALRALAIMKIIEIRQGDGTRITSLEPELLLERFEVVFTLHDSALPDILETQKILEPGLAALAAERISPAAACALEELWSQAVHRLDDPEALLEVDFDLHQKIAHAAGNPVLARIAISLNCLSRRAAARLALSPAFRRQILLDRQAIITAIKAHNPLAAQQATYQYLTHLEQSLAPRSVSPTPQRRTAGNDNYRFRLMTGSLSQFTAEQEKVFAYHVLKAQEHQIYHTTTVTAWQTFLQ